MLKNRVLIKSYLSSAILIFLFTINLFGQDNWKIFTPPDKAFSVLSPDKMEPDADAKNNPSSKGTYTYKDLYSFFAVGYRQFPKMPSDVKLYYVKTRDGAIAGVKGTLIKEQTFTKDGITGWELHIQMENGVERARMFFHANRFYVLLATATEDEIDSEEINNFFNSFVPGEIDITKNK
jgi:hypothetical protein